MAVDLLLICHGQAVQREGDRHFGWWADMPWSDRGRQQAILIGERLKNDFHIDAIYTSPLMRARETAQIVGDCVKAIPAIDHALRELDSGDLAALSYEEARAQYPDIVLGYEFDRIPGGESYVDMHHRVACAIDRIAAQSPDQQVACITHGGPIVAYLRAFVGYSAQQTRKPRFLCGIASLHHLQLEPDGDGIVMALNDIAHLTGLPT